MNKNTVRMFGQLQERGFSFDECVKLRRIEMTLHRWSEQECGSSNDYCSWAIERDEKTNKPFRVVYPHANNNSRRTAIPDREAGALKRLNAIMASHPDYQAYYQGDCRGCALYIVRTADLNGLPIEQAYTRGLAVCD
jgi:hypothetical protein